MPRLRPTAGDRFRPTPGRARQGLGVLLGFLAVLWAGLIADVASGRYLTLELGNNPRRLDGLDGIVFSPLLHANADHLLSNSLPLLVLGFLVFLEGARRFFAVLGLSWLVSGTGTWLLGGGLTIGASGLVFGFFAYLTVRGFYNRSWRQILLAVVLFLVYGSILWGVLPTVSSGISWQGHLFGAAGGVLGAVVLRRRRSR